MQPQVYSSLFPCGIAMDVPSPYSSERKGQPVSGITYLPAVILQEGNPHVSTLPRRLCCEGQMKYTQSLAGNADFRLAERIFYSFWAWWGPFFTMKERRCRLYGPSTNGPNTIVRPCVYADIAVFGYRDGT
ncbi:hypothetical protein AB1N83_014157 [Pleurotus pulmonarius]